MLIDPAQIQAYGWGITLFIAFMWVIPKAAAMVVKLYQDHMDWKRKTQQDKEKYEREMDSNQEAWQRDLIKEMFGQSSAQHQGTIQVLNKQTDVLSALQITIGELKTIILQQQTRRRTDFAKGTVTHEQQKIVAHTDTLTKVEG